MNEYFFYTTAGHTYAPNVGFEIENCQVIGSALGNTSNEAFNNLLSENNWIEKAGFDQEKILVKQILNKELRDEIKTLVDFIHTIEENHFKECCEKKNHILNAIKRLEQI